MIPKCHERKTVEQKKQFLQAPQTNLEVWAQVSQMTENPHQERSSCRKLFQLAGNPFIQFWYPCCNLILFGHNLFFPLEPDFNGKCCAGCGTGCTCGITPRRWTAVQFNAASVMMLV